MNNKEKINFAINQIAINNCDGSANENAIKAVSYLQEVYEAITVTPCCTDVCECEIKTLPDGNINLKMCRKCINEM